MNEIKIDRDVQVKEKNIEVWEDLVNIKSLVVSLLICSAATLGGYIIAPNDPPKPLFFGIAGAALGFIFCSLLIKPKRIVQQVERGE